MSDEMDFMSKLEMQREINKLRKKNELLQKQIDKHLPCADCRDKVKEGVCLRCENQILRQANTALKSALDKSEEALKVISLHSMEMYRLEVLKISDKALSEIQKLKNEGE